MTETSEWTGRVGHAWAAEWRRTDRSFGALTGSLVDPAALGSFVSALDIGCGAGDVALRIAEAHPSAQVIGVDISAELLAIAAERGRGMPNVRFEDADGGSWRAPPDAKPDLLVSRHGVMFFTDPVAAFFHLREQSAPGARLRFSCFRARADNRWVTALASVLPPQPPADPEAPGPFAFADPARVAAILTAAGWTDVELEPVDYTMIAGEGADAIDEAVAYFQRIGPAARAIAELPDVERPAVGERLRALLADHCNDGLVGLPSAAWIVSARAPGMRHRL